MTVNELCAYLDSIAPFDTQSDWDNSGFVAGDGNAEITGIITSLDVTAEEIALAKKLNANTIVSHHPAIFRAVKTLHSGNVVFDAIANSINIISVHTCMDKAPGGVNDSLCEALGMEYVKEAETLGDGFINTGIIAGADTPEKLASHISGKLGAAVRYMAAGDKITRIGVCSGAGAEFCEAARAVGCDAFITGDASYHNFLEAAAVGVSLFAAGHFETENMIAGVLQKKLSSAFPEIKVTASDRKCPIVTVM